MTMQTSQKQHPQKHSVTLDMDSSLTHFIIEEPLRGFIAGTGSGIAKCLIGHPMDLVKVRLQTEGRFGRFRGTLDCLRSTISKEGILSLYKGMSPPLLGWSIMDTVLIGTKVYCDGYLRDYFSLSPETSSFISGALAGWTRAFVACPVERIKANMQVNYSTGKQFRGAIQTVRDLVIEKGVRRGLYSGLSATFLFGTSMGVYFSAFEMWQRCFTPHISSHSALVFFSGGMAANTLWFLCFPGDTIKNRLLVHKSNTRLSVANCIKDIHGREGLRGFYNGFVPCILRSFPANGAAFLAIDLAMKSLP